MKINIIGTGNMAHFIALKLPAGGHRVTCVYTRHPEKTKTLPPSVGTKMVTEMAELDEDADVYIFAVPDKAIEDTVADFPFSKGLRVHCAGALPLDVLKTDFSGVIWPLYSIRKNKLPERPDIPVFYDAGNERAAAMVRELAHSMSSNITRADFGQRQSLHLAAVFANNFVNHLLTVAGEIVASENLSFDKKMLPIIEQTFEDAMQHLSPQSQTGPAIRGDDKTLQRHLALLKQHPEWQAVYKAVSVSIFKMYHK